MADTPDFSFKQSFPIAEVITAAQRKAQLEQQSQQHNQAQLIQGLEAVGKVGQSLFEQKQQMGQALASARLLKQKMDADAMKVLEEKAAEAMATNNSQVTETPFGPVNFGQTANATGGVPLSNAVAFKEPTQENINTPSVEEIATAVRGLSPKDLLSQLFPQNAMFGVIDPETGQVKSSVSAPKGSRYSVLPRPKTGTSGSGSGFQQTQWADDDGEPLFLKKGTTELVRRDGTPARNPGQKKGDESAVADATLLINQIPNVDVLFDSYKAMPEWKARGQPTVAGNLLDPSAKQAESSLKLAAFTFGGKNLTGQEKEVVFGALFPKWTDNDDSRELKRTLLKEYMTGKVDLLEAANLLGPAGKDMRAMIEKKKEALPKAPPPSSQDVLSVGGTFNGQKIVGVKLKKT